MTSSAVSRVFLLLSLFLAHQGLMANGGETCGNATTILALPYTDNGNTSLAFDDYNEACTAPVTGGQDVVYAYTPSINETVNISLCGGLSNFDTKLYVYQNACPAAGSGTTGTQVACNDDECDNFPIYNSPYLSAISNLSLTAGNTYYIVVDGYSNTEFGDYTLTIEAAPGDVGVSAAIGPLVGCNLTANEQVSVTVTNYGTDATNISMYLEVNGQVIANELLPGPITTAGSQNYAFNTTVDLSAPGVYSVRAAASVSSDAQPFNDTLSFEIINEVASALPQGVDFEGFSGTNLDQLFPGWYEAYGVGAPSSIQNTPWVKSSTSQTTAFGSTTTTINLLGTQQHAWIVSPLFMVNALTEVSFEAAITDWLNTTPDAMGSDDSVRLMISTDCGENWTALLVFDAASQPNNSLTTHTVGLAAYAGQEVKVAFYATDGPIDDSEDYDFHLDHILISNPSANDVAVTELIAPNTVCGLTANESITVNLEQLGQLGMNTGDTVEVSVLVDGANLVEDTLILTQDFQSGDVLTHTFSGTFDFSAYANFGLEIWIDVNGDEASSNDTLDILVQHYEPVTVTAGWDSLVCVFADTLYPEPNYFGGTWSGLGVVDPEEGAISTAMIGTGNTATITYTYDAPYGIRSIPYNPTGITQADTVNLLDDQVIQIPIGFKFPFFDSLFSDIHLSSNGLIGFGAGTASSNNVALPSNSVIGNILAFAWMDWDPDNGNDGTISYTTVGTSPSRKFIITFDQVPSFSGLGNGVLSAQVVLLENLGTIEVHYTQLETDGANVTLGLQNLAQNDGVVFPLANNQPVSLLTTSFEIVPTPCGGSDSITITLNAAPSVSFAQDSLNLCPDDEITLVPAASGGTFMWNTGDTTAGVSVSTPGLYKLTVTGNDGQCAISDSVEVVEVTAPIVLVDSVLETGCAGETTGGIYLTLSGGVGPFDYLWTTGDTTLDLENLQSGSFSLLITDAAGCTHQFDTTVLATTQPLNTAFAADLPSCSGIEDGSLDLTVFGGAGPFSYEWSTGDTTEDLSEITSGVYVVTITDANGCEFLSDSVTLLSDNLAPSAGFDYEVAGGTITFTAQTSIADSFHWNFGDGVDAYGDSVVSHEYKSNGNYQVTLVVYNECGTDSITQLIMLESVSINSRLDNVWSVYPNPHGGQFNLMFSGNLGSQTQFRLYDSMGREIHREVYDRVSIGQLQQISLPQDLAEGVYIAQLHTAWGISVKRMMLKR
ncbi:T9SS type A sorting domain-containing protein [Pontibacter sp. G13]|uniref:T9SS type A sorting domain-containing protein n=1 Tax=Pontibacter sp. G13 TaxID=3074898 RepID=UPI0028893C90|nr:T9SS type A sorting domain-containing protein [Pontibacter sp. G13]WNJ16622.1 T9SS type A sorting domain-containing protein [Pontibacter sp. G13]